MHEAEAAVRRAELEDLRAVFSSTDRVVELGAGEGTQAALLRQWVSVVAAVDLPRRERRSDAFDVIEYDGARLPFATGSVDVVYSSNVLEHVQALPALLAESARVLRAGGMALHVVPSRWWRWWSIVAYYPYGLRQTLRRARAAAGTAVARPRRRGLTLLLPPAHGKFRSALRELREYGRAAWVRRFEAAGFTVEWVRPTCVFHTGYWFAPHLPMRSRRALRHVLGAPGTVLAVRPAATARHTAR